MNFRVIDKKTGKEADVYEIALHEEWAKGLVYCDMEGFALLEDGTLILLDECGNFRYCDGDRFEVVFEEERQRGEWIPVSERLPEERPHGEWVINPNGLRIGKVTHYAVVCSLCKWSTLFADNFCPNCGASMVKEGEAE